VLKLNDQGNLEWAKTYGGTRAILDIALFSVSDGNYYDCRRYINPGMDN